LDADLLHQCTGNGVAQQDKSVPGNSVQPDKLIGTVLENKFQIEELIGAGGMARVYKAKHFILGRFVAVKILHSSSQNKSIQRFQQEAKAISALNHPNLAKFLDFGITEQGDPYLVMDLLEGETLQSYIESKGKMPFVEALNLFRQVCDGMAYAHRNQTVHRDLKPSNIMLKQTNEGVQAVIFDFGIARMSGEADSENKLTQTGDIFGSPLYMSPEQCKGMHTDHRSDIYSLGCVLFEMLSGRPPLEGINAFQTMNLHVTANAPSIQESCPELPAEIDTVLKRMLAKDPENRYSSVSDLSFDVQLIAQQEPVFKLVTAPALPAKKGILRGRSALVKPLTKRVIAVVSALFGSMAGLFLGCLLIPKAEHLALLLLLCLVLASAAVMVSLMIREVVLALRAPVRGSLTKSIPEHLLPLNRLIASNMINADAPLAIKLGTEYGGEDSLYMTVAMREHNPHVLITGCEDMGKTRFLANIFARDIRSATLVIDTYGDLVDLLLNCPREGRITQDDCIYLDPSSPTCGLCLNPFLLKEVDMEVRAQIVVTAFRTANDALGEAEHSWVADTAIVLRYACLILMSQQSPFEDLLEFIADPNHRQELLSRPKLNASSESIARAAQELERLAGSPHWAVIISPILNVVMMTAGDAALRQIVFGTNRVDFVEAMREKKPIVLCLKRSTVGSASPLIAALACQQFAKVAEFLYENERGLESSAIYIDGAEKILDAALVKDLMAPERRNLKLAVIATMRSVSQLRTKVIDSIFAHVGLVCAFRADYADSLILARHMMPTESVYTQANSMLAARAMRSDLIGLPVREYFAWFRECTAGLFRIQSPLFDLLDPRAAKTLHDVGRRFAKDGKYAEAERCYQQSLEIREKECGPNHPDLCQTLENYAELLRKTNRNAEASELDARARAIREAQK